MLDLAVEAIVVETATDRVAAELAAPSAERGQHLLKKTPASVGGAT